jgi:hypothetical protein
MGNQAHDRCKFNHMFTLITAVRSTALASKMQKERSQAWLSGEEHDGKVQF